MIYNNQQLKIFLLFLLMICFYIISPSNVIAKDITNIDNVSKVDCGLGAYIQFKSKTFDNPVAATCEKVEPDNIKGYESRENISPIYKITIIDKTNGQEIKFFRNEATVYISNDIIKNETVEQEEKEKMIFFYDNMLQDWVSYNTTNSQTFLEGKLMHTGYFTVFNKEYYNDRDLFTKISFYILVFGICASLIYVIIKK